MNDWTPAEENFLMKQFEKKTLTKEEIIKNFITEYGYERRTRIAILGKIKRLLKDNPELSYLELSVYWTPAEENFLMKQFEEKTLTKEEIIKNFITEYGRERRTVRAIRDKIERLLKDNPELSYPELSTDWTPDEENFLIRHLKNKTLTYKEIIESFINKYGRERKSIRGIETKISKLIEKNPDLYRKKVWTPLEENFLREKLNENITPTTIIDNFIKKFGNRSRRGIREKITRLLKKKTPKNNLRGNTNLMSTTSTTESTTEKSVYPFKNSNIEQQYNSGSLPYMKQNNHSYINNMIDEESYNINFKKRTTRNQTGNRNTSLGYTNPMSRTYTSNPNNNFQFISNNNLKQNMNQGNLHKNYDLNINNMVKELQKRTTPKNNRTGHRNSMLNNTNNHFNISQSNSNDKLQKRTTNTMSSQTNKTRNRTDNEKNNIPSYKNTLPSNNSKSLPYNNRSLPYQEQLPNINHLIGVTKEIYYKNKNNENRENENGEKDNMVLQKSDPVNPLGNIY